MTRWMEAGNRRKEDSGLIDLDALMRQASSSTAVDESGERPIVVMETKKAKETEKKKKETLIPPPKNEPPKSEAPVTGAATIESTPALVTPIPTPRVPTKVAPPPVTATASERKGGSRPLVAAGITLALIGAGLYGYLRGSAPAGPSPVVVATPREPAVATPRPLEASNQPAQPALPSASDLPSVALASASASAPASTLAVAKRVIPGKQVEPVVTTTEAIPESTAQGNDLGRAMHDAVGDGSSRVAKVEGTRISDARTLRPSPGAVIGALNAVLPAARECLGPDDAIRVGMVTFRSDGTVAKVELNGKRESDDCVRSAIARARVEPFADDAFSTRVTVRP